MKLFNIEKISNLYQIKIRLTFLFIKFSFKIFKLQKFKLILFNYKYKKYLKSKKDNTIRRLFLTNGNLNLINTLSLINQLELNKNSKNTLLVWTPADEEYEKVLKNISNTTPLEKYLSFCNKSHDYVVKYFIDNFLTDYDEIYFTNGHELFYRIAKLYPNIIQNITDEGINPLYPANFIDYSKIKNIYFTNYLNKINRIGALSYWRGGVSRNISKDEFLKISSKLEKLYPLDIKLNPNNKNIIFLATFCSKKSSQFFTFEELTAYQNTIIKKLIKKGYKVYFKPHPRDLKEYKDNENFKILKTKLPIECYNLKDKCLAIVSLFSSALCQMYHYQNIAGFCATDLIKKADNDIGINIIKEYSPNVNVLLEINTKSKTFEELRDEINKEYLNFIKDKPLLSENKVIEKLYEKLIIKKK